MILNYKFFLPISLVVLYTIGILSLGQWTKKMDFVVSNNLYINSQFNFQIGLLVITFISLLTTYFLHKENFAQYFSLGNINAIGQELKIFGIAKGDSWMKTGLSLSVLISIVTGVFMYFQLKNHMVDYSILKPAILWILLFSLTNSFAEEMIFRLGIVSPLSGLLSPIHICFISAILFGLPHFAGMPSGIIGATMAGVLGFVLTKSMLETSGFFWAWFIHFLQDIIIIGSLYLINTKL